MKYVQINTFSNGSTGTVMMQKHRELLDEGCESYVAWARGRQPENEHEILIGSMLDVYAHGAYVRLTDKMGFASRSATAKLLEQLDKIDPDVVHLHNVHGYYLNIELLFEWLASHRCQVKWTLHDCWAFTGHCGHFTHVQCMQWRTHCALNAPCEQLDLYPKTFSKANCSWNYSQKKRLFNLIPDHRMTIITPSNWLANLVKESYLSKYRVEVKHNTVDASIFKPTPSDFRERYQLGGKFIVLGVASPWTERKGLSDFYRLVEDLGSECAIVLVGLSKKQIAQLPKPIVGIQRTESKEELAAIYTAANVFFNPTREDNYPTVNLEAQACGTPVITYDTGGCAETISTHNSRTVIGYDEALALLLSARDSAQAGSSTGTAKP